ncbi:MAG: AAA family ATPase [Armatimonadota bacterium]
MERKYRTDNLTGKTKIEINEQFALSLDLMENTGKNIFITGKAGTGKSTLLDYFRDTTKKKAVVLAPTGVAAVNVRGQTIHSFFKFKPNVTLRAIKRISGKKIKIYKKLEAVIIDEISMVRADLLDCVDKFLRLNGKNHKLPFGGVQMIFIGDLYQLPPVVVGREREIFRKQYESPYFFSAKIFDDFSMEFIELEKIYRQKDEAFINLLNSIRNNSIDDAGLKTLNKRYNPDFKDNIEDFYIYLTTTNKLAEEINNRQLMKLEGNPYYYKGEIQGDFDSKYLPTPAELCVKIGAQIMMLNNDLRSRWINGSIGRIVDIEHDREYDKDIIIVELIDGNIVKVSPHTWEIFNFFLNEETNSIEAKTVGSFTQYPLKLAWAVTIHKSQGKTFNKVIIDIGKGTFAHGQMYVALSRCTSLEGIVLKKPIQKKHIFMDWRVVKFVTKYQYKISEKTCSTKDKIEIIENAIKSKSKLDVIYLKPNDEKSKRIIRPEFVGEMEYLGKTYLGVKAFCFNRKESRTFRVDRILEMKNV